MSVTIKSKSDIQKLREAGRIAANALVHAGKVMHPGMTTKQLDKSIHDFIVGCGAVPTFLGYGGFPASACISINDEIIHGIPSHKRVIHEGDIVSVDVGATFNGFVGDTAYTFAVGDISEEAADLLRVTEASLYAAIDAAQVGARLGDVSHTVEEYCGSRGYPFKPEYAGQLNFYINVVDDKLRGKDDNKTIGLLLCKGKDEVVAQYALTGYDQPIGISDYQLSKAIPENLKSILPSIEEVEEELTSFLDKDNNPQN